MFHEGKSIHLFIICVLFNFVLVSCWMVCDTNSVTW